MTYSQETTDKWERKFPEVAGAKFASTPIGTVAVLKDRTVLIARWLDDIKYKVTSWYRASTDDRRKALDYIKGREK